MLDTLSSGFRNAKQVLLSQKELTAQNIGDALKQVRLSLLEADVDYQVTKDFLARVQEKALGLTVQTAVKTKQGKKVKLTPSEHFVGICYEELEALMGGDEPEELSFSHPVGTIMMVGLQGAGKTTSTAKLAKHLAAKGHRPLLVAADIYRPAAVLQLKSLAKKLEIPVFHEEGATPQEICKAALAHAKNSDRDVVIFDTAGRLAIDEVMMQELSDIRELSDPDHVFLVVDAMIGQDAAVTAQAFHKRLSIDGTILTKLDGDARGGAALSIVSLTKKPIRFVGMGEHLNELEPFRPSGMASRILGMGDVVSLAKDFETHIDEKEAEESAKKAMSGQFSLQDFLGQLKSIKKMGPLKGIMEKLPGMSDMMASGVNFDEKGLSTFESMIGSMTKKERENPQWFLTSQSRRKRVALGSGLKESAVTEFIKRFMSMKKVMKTLLNKPSLFGSMPFFKNMAKSGQIMDNFGQNAGGSFAGFPELGGMGMGPSGKPKANLKSLPNAKDKKVKRKAQKLARKKNKKKKK